MKRLALILAAAMLVGCQITVHRCPKVTTITRSRPAPQPKRVLVCDRYPAYKCSPGYKGRKR